MKNMTLRAIAEACGGTLYCENPELEIQGAVIDSRQVETDYLFFAVKGERVDGYDFIPKVMEMGAAAVVSSRRPEDEKVPCILVEDVLQALKDTAEYYRGNLSIPIVGITGSVGKTSTKECIASVLEQKYDVLKTAGNFNNEIGVPLTVLQIREHHQAAVLEMGINHFGEMHRLSKVVRPDVVVMTNIGQCHLEFLGSRDGILKAKSEIFDYASPNAEVFVNGDDDKLQTLKEINGKAVHSFGIGENCSLYAEQIVSKGLLGSEFVVRGSESLDGLQMQIPLPGVHMVSNALAAASVGCALGLSREEIAAGIAAVKPTGGRSNIIKGDRFTLIDDCYNANPGSMKAAIDLLCLAEGRKVAVLGDMFELGEDEALMHAQVGAYAAERGIDLLICVGGLSESMMKGAQERKTALNSTIEVKYYPDKESLKADWCHVLKDGDQILLKASHGMGFAELVENLRG